MKRILMSISLVLLIGFNIAYAQDPRDDLDISTAAYILIDADTGTVVSERKPDAILYPASITKIMTAILAIEKGDFNKPFIVSKNAIRNIGVGGSRVGLIPGEKVYLEDLLYMLLLPSGNDAANVIAENIAGDIEGFVKLMNQKAEKIGTTNTVFENPVGLDCGDGYPNHKTTARDFAMITRYAMSLQKYRQVVSTPEYKLPTTNKHKHWNKVRNTNRFLTSIDYNKNLYEVNGGKTGRTRAAFNTLVVSAKNKDDVELICVLLKNPNRTRIFSDAKKVFDYGFTLIKDKKVNLSSSFYDIRFRASKELIKSFSDLGYISGYQDNTFRPDAVASKEQFITLFMKMTGKAYTGSSEYWSKPYLDAGVQQRLIGANWYTHRLEPIKVKEAINVLHKGIEREMAFQTVELTAYSDVARNSMKREMLKLSNQYITSEDSGKLTEALTREEMVILLDRYMNLWRGREGTTYETVIEAVY